MNAPSPRRESALRYAIVMGVVLVLSLLLGLAPGPLEGSTQALTSGWQWRTTDASSLAPLDEPWDAPGWTPIAMPAHPSRIDGEVLWLRTRLPPMRLRDPAVAIDAVIAPFEVFVRKERVHAHPPDGITSTRIPGVPWQLVTLPASAEEATFALRVRTDGRSALVRGTPLYGERADHIAWALKRDAARLACGLFVILIGLSAFVVFVRRDDWQVPAGFALWTISIGLYVVHYTHAKDVLIAAPGFWFCVWLVAVPTLPLGASMFVNGVFGSGPRRIVAHLVRFHAGLVALVLVSDAVSAAIYARERAFAIAVFTVPIVIVRVSYFVSGTILVVVVARRARQGHREARIFLAGFFLSAAFAVNDLLAAFGVAGLSWKSLAHWGGLTIAIALAFILQRRYGTALERAAAFANEVRLREREKESLLRDLHDGVGSLTSNIRMLAELGQKSDERAKRSLSTIAELSDKSLGQLRAFVQALDDTTTTWESLAGELRRFGQNLLSAAGIELEVTTELTTKELPRGLLSIHVLRVFQESLTNALKRRATRIEATLRANDTRMELVVVSKGSSGESAANGMGLDLGRGLANMKSRAVELGGSFTIERGSATSVTLYVPLPFRIAVEGLPRKPPDVDLPGALASEE